MKENRLKTTDMEPLDNIGGIHRECAEERHKEFQRDHPGLVLKSGDFVKISFSDVINMENETEHMWVKVTDVIDKRTYRGLVDNDPVLVTNVQCGTPVVFNIKEVQQLIT